MKVRFNDYDEYSSYFRELIELERREEMRRHWDEIRKLPGWKRERLGRAILNLRAKILGRGLGGVHLVRYSRANFPETDISVGDVVLVSGGRVTRHNPTGTVYEKGRNFITVAFQNLPPRFATTGKIRVDLYASDITFQRMLAALKKIEHRSDLLPFLLSSRVMLFSDSSAPNYHNERLNKSQQTAVTRSLGAERFFLIYGPPGTGKTTTMVESILQHVNRGEKVLVTADSNIAVDNLVERLAERVSVVRLGAPARTTLHLREHTLDYLVQALPEFAESQKLWDEVDKLVKRRDRETKPSPQWRRGLGDDEILYLASQRRSIRGIPAERIVSMAEWLKIQQKISELAERAKKLEKRAVWRLLSETSVVCATNSTAGSELLDDFEFDTVFIDEATQSTEPACLIPMTRGRRFILAGDHNQLPPTVLSREAEPLKFTLFERLMALHGSGISSMLTVQYRMNERIMRFPNREFYGGAVRSAEHIARISLAELGVRCPGVGLMRDVCAPENIVVFIDTHGTMPERQHHGSTSYENPGEAGLVSAAVNTFIDGGVAPESIGVITPYDDQVELLKSELPAPGLEIKSVDGFQGREKEIIVISFVRSNKGNIGFLMDYRRLNVSLTRARRKLVMVGDADTLAKHMLYRKLITYVSAVGKYLRV